MSPAQLCAGDPQGIQGPQTEPGQVQGTPRGPACPPWNPETLSQPPFRGMEVIRHRGPLVPSSPLPADPTTNAVLTPCL